MIIHRGRFVTQSSTAELAARAAAGVRIRSPQSDRLRSILAGAGMSVVEADDGALLVVDGTPERVGELAAANNIVLHELAAEKATLEEAFLELTGGGDDRVRLLFAELLKVRTAPRTLLGLVLGMVAIVILGAASTASGVEESPLGEQSSLGEENTRWDVLTVATTAVIFTLILGILIVTWEYRHGTITQTFLGTPRRERVMGAKYAVAFGVAAVLAAISLIAVLVTAAFWLSAELTGGQWELVGRIVLGAALLGCPGSGARSPAPVTGRRDRHRVRLVSRRRAADRSALRPLRRLPPRRKRWTG